MSYSDLRPPVQQSKAKPTGLYTYKQVFRIWRDAFEQHCLFPDPVFTTLHVHNPNPAVSRPFQVGWVLGDELNDEHLTAQAGFYNHPNSYYWRSPMRPSAGLDTTLKGLWALRYDPEKMAAWLIMGSLHLRCISARRVYPGDNWPSFTQAMRLYSFAENRLKGTHVPRWHGLSTETLPYHASDQDAVSGFEGLIAYLAAEHAEVLRRYVPVVIQYSDQVVPAIEDRLTAQAARYRAAMDEAASRRAKAREARETVEREKDERYPRWREWPLDAEVLTEMVWTAPATDIAQLFGVSDVAISKRCKALGVAKPPRGFWAKVWAGHIPHPNGVPVGRGSYGGRNGF